MTNWHRKLASRLSVGAWCVSHAADPECAVEGALREKLEQWYPGLKTDNETGEAGQPAA